MRESHLSVNNIRVLSSSYLHVFEEQQRNLPLEGDSNRDKLL